MIGDSLTSDMQGAVNAGLDSIWYTGAWQDASDSVPYTYQAKSYQEILELLYRL